jgi:tRNA-dihydrouridine synthase A
LEPLNRRFCVAPMLDWTDRHYRYMARLLSQTTLLYTEMVTTGAIIYGQGDYLQFNMEEHPVALQLGGRDPHDLAFCAKKGEQYGYDEINLNVGCPSSRVQNGGIGACLMKEPQQVADCVAAMKAAVDIPVTVKTRIGVDNEDSFEALCHFIETVYAQGCDTFIIHARKAWLKGLSPKQNRDIPPLNYPSVYQLKQCYPHITFVINGGITNFSEIHAHLTQVDGVMVGREAYSQPWLLSQVDTELCGMAPQVTEREALIESMLPYIERHLKQGGRVSHCTRHMMGLFQGVPNGKRWRRYLSEHATNQHAGTEIITDALAYMKAVEPQQALA